ncbi:MAG: hypothetical protein IMY67_07500 [Bacteroidetes bacterium]|nr:hypothetical protein [Bacteroidota bacterium]
MKHVIKILAISFTLGCKAQSPIIPMYNSPVEETPECYVKDMDNDFNPFVREWKWEEGNSSLTLQFQKIEMYHDTSNQYFNFYSDYLIGEYKYIENSNVLVNTLPVNFAGNPYDNNITGAIISTSGKREPPCDECAANTRFIWTAFGEPQSPQLTGRIVMAHFIEKGIEKIRARIYNTGIVNLTADYTGPEALKVPEGIYTFIKQ